MTPAQARARSSSRRAAGMCLGCGEVPVLPCARGLRRCDDCRMTAASKREAKALRVAPVTEATLFEMVERIERWESTSASSAAL